MITNFSTSSVRTGVKRKRFWDQNAVANSFFSIATVTLSGSQSNIEFTNIPQTYTHLQIRGIGRDTIVGAVHSLNLQFNSNTGSNYTYHAITGDGATASSGSLSSQTNQYPGYLTGANNTSSIFAATIIDILDYTNTNKFKTTRTISAGDGNGSGNVGLFSGAFLSTSAITSIKLLPYTSTNFVQYTSFALYGVLA